MRFNVSKSSVIRIGKRYKHQCAPLIVGNDILKFVDEVKYLGVFFVAGSHVRLNINKQKAKFYSALNGILYKCGGHMNEMVTFHLINTFCRPLLLYGCDCVTLNKSSIDSLNHSWNRIYWKLFKVNDLQCISDIQSFMCDISITDDIASRYNSFLSRIRVSRNQVMLLLYSLV